MRSRKKIELTTYDGKAYFLPKEERSTIKINNFGAWERGFRIYMSLYAQAHPSRVPEMLQYISTIQHASTKYVWENVAYYDNVFRHWMAKNPNRNWGTPLSHIWNMAMCDPISISRVTQSLGGKGGRKDNKGVCFRFNKGICSGPCRFIHRCTYCGGTSHGAHVCFKKNNRKSNNSGENTQANNSNNSHDSGNKQNKKPAAAESNSQQKIKIFNQI